VFITDAPLKPEEVDYFTGRMQHANIELIFYEDLPLASLPLKEYERKGSATLVGNFYSSVEVRISVRNETGEPASRADLPAIPKPEEIGELFIRGSFLPNRLTLGALVKEDSLAKIVSNGDWRPAGAVGYLDDQSRFWLTERIAR
jgi:hypothetical protein